MLYQAAIEESQRLRKSQSEVGLAVFKLFLTKAGVVL